MSVEAFLMQEGLTPLRSNLVGDIVADWVEVATGDPVLPSDTAQSVLEKLHQLADHELANRILYKDIHEELLQWQSWQQIAGALSNSPEAKTRMRAVNLLVGVITVMTVGFGSLLGWRFIVSDIMPTTENLLVVFGPLAFAISLLFGVTTDTALSFASSVAARRKI